MATENPALERAISKAGGMTALARLLNLSGHQVVYQWRLNQVPAERCPDIEALTGERCEDLRPDVNWSVIRGTALPTLPQTKEAA